MNLNDYDIFTPRMGAIKTLFNTFSLSWFGLVMVALIYISQHLRPQNILGVGSFPLFSLLSSAFLVILALHGGTRLIKKHSQMRWIFFILVWLMYLTITSDYRSRSLTEYKVFAQQFIFVAGFVALVDSYQKLKLMMNTISVTTIMIVIYTFLTHHKFARYEMFDSLSNFLVDPNDLSLYLNMMIPFIILSFSNTRGLFIKSFYLIGAILTALLSLLTYSRGGFLGFSIMAFCMIMTHPKRIPLSLICIAMVICIIPFLGDSWADLMATATDTQSRTAQTRITMWSAAFQYFLINPMGSGPNTIPALAYNVIPDNVLGMHHLRWYGDVVHSFWLTLMTEWGIPGFLSVLYIILLNTIDCIKLMALQVDFDGVNYLKGFGRSALSSMAGFLVSASFLTANYYPHFWYLTAFICSASFLMFINLGEIYEKPKE